MACAEVDMEIEGDYEEGSMSDHRDTAMIRYYQASELLPDNRGPLHGLLQKQPAVLGVRGVKQEAQTLV